MKAFLLTLVALSFSLPVKAEESLTGRTVIDDCWKAGGSHVAIVDCEFKVLQKLKSEMQALYEKRLEEARAMDEELKNIGSSLTGVEKNVVASQEAFDTYLKNECSRRVSYVAGGTAGADVSVGCQIDLIGGRITALKSSI